MQSSAGSGEAAAAQVFDARGLQAPDNILAILKKASELSNGSVLEIRIDSNPMQLYDLLQQRGYFLEMKCQPDGTYLGRVRQRDIEGLMHD